MLPEQSTGASGAAAAFSTFFNSSTSFTVLSGSGVSTAGGPLVVGGTHSHVTVAAASAVVDTSAGGNAITVTTASVVFAGPNDAISAAAGSMTLFGAGSGVTQFDIRGGKTSITGGTGGIVGTVSGANSTLVGGSGKSIYHVTGWNDFAVGGPSGVTVIDASASTGPEAISTNPLRNAGALVAILGSGPDSVVGGSGASTVAAGTGSDVFGFIKGHAGGSEVIIGFNARDDLAFAGYGYGTSNLPVETVGSLGDVMTLSDGTTILLAGIDHKIF
ncbi:MAG: hypothetical protein HIU92_11795 [Proteobacteria bacterium]|nr:hypothetical protein [Pseudomonadota bacterium]